MSLSLLAFLFLSLDFGGTALQNQSCRALGEWRSKPFRRKSHGWSRKGRAFQAGAWQPCDAARFWYADFGACWYASCPWGTVTNTDEETAPTQQEAHRWPVNCPCVVNGTGATAVADVLNASVQGVLNAPVQGQEETNETAVSGLTTCSSDMETCNAAGNHQYTRSFSGDRFKLNGFGVYQVAATKSGCFDVQAFRCRPQNSDVGAFAGIFVRMGATTVTVINKTVSVNGTTVFEPYPEDAQFKMSSLTEDLLVMQGCNKCARLLHVASSFKRPLNASWARTPSYDQDLSVDVGIEDVENTGLCASNSQSPLPESMIGFSSTEMEQMCSMCDANCSFAQVQGSGLDADALAQPYTTTVLGNGLDADPLAQPYATTNPDEADSVTAESQAQAEIPTSGVTTDVLAGASDATGESWDELKPECEIDGGDHVQSFDGMLISPVQHLASVSSGLSHAGQGLNWVVKTPSVSMQALFGRSSGGAFLRALAVGGPFLQNNKLIIGSQTDSVMWNGLPILQDVPSDFNVTGLITARRVKGSPQVRDRKSKSVGVEITLPQGVHLLVGRVATHVNIAVRMKQAGEQDGYCGNFNGISDDDNLNLVEERGSIAVTPSESLF